jgi:hypothetical protein
MWSAAGWITVFWFGALDRDRSSVLGHNLGRIRVYVDILFGPSGGAEHFRYVLVLGT